MPPIARSSMFRLVSTGLRTLRKPSVTPVSFTRAFCTSKKPANIESATDELFNEDENQLENKQTRDEIHNAFSLRAQDAIRYDYFAQRAELEAELEAASSFRGLREMAKQQAMGYLELMEEYGDAGFGGTFDNLEISAATERQYAEELFVKGGEVAANEKFDQIEEWFDDMVVASSRAAGRLELTSSMMEAEEMGDDMMGVDDLDDMPEKVKN